MADAEKMEFDLYKANKELQHNLKTWDSPVKRIMNWVMSGDPQDDTWNKEGMSLKNGDEARKALDKEFNNF